MIHFVVAQRSSMFSMMAKIYSLKVVTLSRQYYFGSCISVRRWNRDKHVSMDSVVLQL